MTAPFLILKRNRTKMIAAVILASATVFLAGCRGPATGGSPLVGNWLRSVSGVANSVEFHADHTYTIYYASSVERGVWKTGRDVTEQSGEVHGILGIGPKASSEGYDYSVAADGKTALLRLDERPAAVFTRQ